MLVTNTHLRQGILGVLNFHQRAHKFSHRLAWEDLCFPTCLYPSDLTGFRRLHSQANFRQKVLGHRNMSSKTMEQEDSNLIIEENLQELSLSSSYETAMEALSSLITRQKRGEKSNIGGKYSKLDRMSMYIKILGLEEHMAGLKIIHVAGTKGKGSTCAFSEAILSECGFRTGLFTSPHLIDVRERFRLDRLDISEEIFLFYFWDCWNQLKEKVTEDLPMPPLFQFLTLLAFKIFICEKVDVAIIEVGLGGTVDSTNINEPVVCGIASLGMDHMETLGDTLGKIAAHKAGILKAPGPDGFTMAALQGAWEIIKEDVMKVFEEFYRTGIINKRTNATYICLIPKKINSIAVKDFRPISLVSSLYKVIAKTLAIRLKKVLPGTIDNSQGAFVEGRQILDPALIANEVVEEYKSKKKQGVVVKVDFEKAYDHVNWEFLQFVLAKKGFGKKWRKWIGGCLISANFSIILNGKPRGKFDASRGLRQGDPLSPSLFIIVADTLSRLMIKAREENIIKGFEVGRDRVGISHLQFADDSIFFIDNSEASIMNLWEVLNIFSKASGLKMNLNKSVLVGLNVGGDVISNYANSVGCLCGEWPLSYLGLPLGGNPNSHVFWEPVLEKMSKRIEGWYKGALSRGGRLVLLQSVLGSIPTYFMSLFKMPVKTVKVVEKLMRDFFWKGNGDGNGDNLVKWEMVAKPKVKGGIGIGNIGIRNTALLGKWLWRFYNERDSLWCRVIVSKYGFHSNGWDPSRTIKSTLRSPWKAVMQGWNNFSKSTLLVVGNGERVRFWEDEWAAPLLLKDRFARLFSIASNKGGTVSEALEWDGNGNPSWNLQFQRNFNDWEIGLYAELLDLIKDFKPALDREDKRVWKGDKSGLFSAKSFFDLLCNEGDESNFLQHKLVWSSGVPTKIRVFAWLASLGKLSTYDVLQRRRPFWALSPSVCVMCRSAGDSIDHLLLHCPFARDLWQNVRNMFHLIGAVNRSWAEWMVSQWSFGRNAKKGKVVWRFMVLSLSWQIWLERNKRIFENTESTVRDVWDLVLCKVNLWARASNIFDKAESVLFDLDCNSWSEVFLFS